MPKSLNVDPADLFMSADHLDMREAEHTAAHGSANANIEAATSGWIGSSATGLQEKLEHLKNITTHVRKELEHHREAFRAVGNRYQTIDEEAAAEIIRAHQNL